ncbi:MAG: hypothetical protein COZ24_06440, partial [Hydrogenophilales bacterium CG_4_10_14_3_um_filter_63_21]
MDIKRVKEIGRDVAIPLVLHGGTGVPEEQLRQAIAFVRAKINALLPYGSSRQMR